MRDRVSRSRNGAACRSAAALGLVVGALILAQSHAARAVNGDPRAEAKAEVERAEVQYKLGRFDEALEAYSRAYELFNAPSLLFDIGQCHKNMRSYERAIFFFEEYLREETNPERRTLANELVAESKAALEKQRLQPPEPPEAQQEGASAIAAPTWRDLPPDAEGRAGVTVAPVPPVAGGVAAAPAPVSVTRKWWFWTAVGALAIAGGAIVLLGTGGTNTVPPSGSVGTLDRRR